VRKPLVPIDGSESAARALAHALAESRGDRGAELHVLTVRTRPMHAYPGKLVSPDLIDQELRREGEALLDQALQAVPGARKACVRHVRIGQPAIEIASAAEELGCDAVVMGTRGMGAVAGLLMGSVATKVVHGVDLPVTLVK
jgi:nucleotide-binding universal stress UspA family protein